MGSQRVGHDRGTFTHDPQEDAYTCVPRGLPPGVGKSRQAAGREPDTRSGCTPLTSLKARDLVHPPVTDKKTCSRHDPPQTCSCPQAHSHCSFPRAPGMPTSPALATPSLREEGAGWHGPLPIPESREAPSDLQGQVGSKTDTRSVLQASSPESTAATTGHRSGEPSDLCIQKPRAWPPEESRPPFSPGNETSPWGSCSFPTSTWPSWGTGDSQIGEDYGASWRRLL